MFYFIQKLFYPPYGWELIVTYTTIPETNILIYSYEIYKKIYYFYQLIFFLFEKNIS